MLLLRPALRLHAPRHLFVFSLLAIIVHLFSVTTVPAQGVGSSRGLPEAAGESNVISGKVVFPGAAPENKRVSVRLDSINAVTGSTQTDDDGTFRFNGLPNGQYTLTVNAGPDYDPTIERVSIDREASLNGNRIVQVQLFLKPKGAESAMFAGVPTAAVDLYKKAVESAHAGNTKKQTEQLASAVAIYPNFGLAQSELGTAYLKLGQLDKAEIALAKAVEIQPKDFTSQSNLGIALLNKKNFPEAEAHLRAAIAINAGAPTTHMYLGISLISQTRDEKTKAFINPEKYSEAQAELETATSKGKDEVAQAHKYLGGIYWGNKQYQKAADEFETFLKLAPKAPEAERIRQSIKELRTKQ